MNDRKTSSVPQSMCTVNLADLLNDVASIVVGDGFEPNVYVVSGWETRRRAGPCSVLAITSNLRLARLICECQNEPCVIEDRLHGEIYSNAAFQAEDGPIIRRRWKP